MSRVDRVRNILAWIFLAMGVAIFLWRIFAPATMQEFVCTCAS